MSETINSATTTPCSCSAAPAQPAAAPSAQPQGQPAAKPAKSGKRNRKAQQPQTNN